MSNYCLLPNNCQKDFAEYLANQYGKDFGDRYLAVATNPNPFYKKSGSRGKSDKQLPQIKYAALKKVFDVVGA